MHTHAQDPPSFITLTGADSTSQRAFIGLPQGGFLIVTTQSGSVGAGSTLVRTDANGAPVEAFHTPDIINRTVLCSDSGFLILGSALIKTDADLHIQWAKRMPTLPSTYYHYDIAENGGTHYLTGNIQEVILDPDLGLYGTWAAVIFKFDDAGNFVDQAILADTTWSAYRFGMSFPNLAPASDGTVYLSFSMLPQALAGTCNRQPTVARLNSDLDVQWCYRYPVSSYNNVQDLLLTRGGDLLLTGGFSSNWTPCNYNLHYFQRIDTAGDLVLAKAHKHPFRAQRGHGSPTELADSTLLFAHTFQDTVLGRVVPYLDHIGADGSVIGSNAYHHPNGTYNYAIALAVDGNGELAADRINTPDTLLFTPVSSALEMYCYTAPNTTVDSAINIMRLDFDPAEYLTYPFSFVDTLYAAFTPALAEALVDCDFSTTVQPHVEDGWSVHPNPSNGVITVAASSAIEALVITDALGRVVHRSSPFATSVSVEIPENGIYFFRIVKREGDRVGKVVIDGR